MQPSSWSNTNSELSVQIPFTPNLVHSLSKVGMSCRIMDFQMVHKLNLVLPKMLEQRIMTGRGRTTPRSSLGSLMGFGMRLGTGTSKLVAVQTCEWDLGLRLAVQTWEWDLGLRLAVQTGNGTWEWDLGLRLAVLVPTLTFPAEACTVHGQSG